MDIDFLRVDEVLAIHQDQIERYGGAEGLRDPGLLISAVETARAMFEGAYLHRDLFEMAAAYLYHIARNHPFLDGNKRTAAASALVFLDFNGVEVNMPDEDLVDLVLAVAGGTADKATVAGSLRTYAT
ncbi:MAG: type II toxin-antitoxin system death-on-curing family toxin [Phycisphaeraceae bacterium]|nr:type II toxin-antitoxin system death-on-curing family toxin [Phycisphaerae bacterium]MBX3391087.1 type II toxin-antitoxin system death-on-curing family toxin [Phycisphaeraceae bacterium]